MVEKSKWAGIWASGIFVHCAFNLRPVRVSSIYELIMHTVVLGSWESSRNLNQDLTQTCLAFSASIYVFFETNRLQLLPAAKPTGHRKVRVVVVVVVVDYFEGRPKEKVKVNSTLALLPLSPTYNFLRGGIRRD